jgi:hypothetical protein
MFRGVGLAGAGACCHHAGPRGARSGCKRAPRGGLVAPGPIILPTRTSSTVTPLRPEAPWLRLCLRRDPQARSLLTRVVYGAGLYFESYESRSLLLPVANLAMS